MLATTRPDGHPTIAGSDAQGSITVVEDLLATARPTAYSYFLLILAVLVTVAEGSNIAAMLNSAPLLAEHFKLSSTELGMTLAFGIGGMIAGSLFLSPLADRYGRRPSVMVGLGLISLGGLGAALARDVNWFLAARLLSGLGIGFTSPAVYALIAEVLPLRMRAMGTIIVGCGFMVGTSVSSLIGSFFIDDYGYRAPFFVSVVMEFIVIAMCLIFLVESPFILARRGAAGDRIARLLRRLGADVGNEATTFVTRDADKPSKGTVRTLLSAEHRVSTLLFWVCAFCALMIAFSTGNWLTALMVRAGADVSGTLRLISVMSLASVLVSIGAALVTTRFNPAGILAGMFACLTISAVILGLFTGIPAGFYPFLTVHFALTAVAQFCLVGVINRYSNSDIRAASIGYALGVGRIGAVMGPLIGGALVSAGLSINGFYSLVAVPSGVAFLAVTYLILSGRLRDSTPVLAGR